MDKDSLKKVLVKKPQGPIERYEHEKDLSEKYVTEGIKVYLRVDDETSAEDIMKKVGMEEGKFIEIIDFMEKNNLIQLGETISKTEEIPSEPVKEEVPPPKPAEEIQPPKEEPQPLKPKEEMPPEEPKEKIPIFGLPKEEIPKKEPEEEKKEEIPPEAEKEEEVVEEEEKAPPKEEEPEKPPEMPPIQMLKTEEESQAPKKEELPPEKPSEEQMPLHILKTEGFVEAVDKSSALKALVTSEKPKEEVQVEPTSRLKSYGKPRTPRTPLEKKLYNKFGDDGLYAYSLIDEFKTPREILKQTGMSEERLKEIIEFMKGEGIIKLERPLIASAEMISAEEKRPQKPAAPQKTLTPYRSPPVTIPLQLKPTPPAPAQPQKPVEAPKPVAAPPKPVEAPKPFKPVPFNKQDVCVSTALPLKLVNKLKLEGELLRRYGNDGSKVLSLMNGKKLNVKIMKELKMSPARFDDINSFLLQNCAIKVQCLTPENVRELYGDEGFAIYNRYGRDGILLYEFIDKKSSLRDIVKMSGIDPRLAVEIFSYIHKVLGLDIPIDTQLLYKQLGIKP